MGMTEYRDELRCYTFTIFQLSPIQQGIQAGHAAVEMFPKYIGGPGVQVQQMLNDWARHNKTMVCLNGGQVSDLKEMVAFLDSEDNPYPWAPFVESEDFLAGITTSVAIILPRRFYEAARVVRSVIPGRPHQAYNYDARMGIHRVAVEYEPGFPKIEEFSEWEFGLMERMNRAPLAR
jgi:hypothetical protein